MKQLPIILKLRNSYKRSMMRTALADRIILVFYSLRNLDVLSYFFGLVVCWCVFIILKWGFGFGGSFVSYFTLPHFVLSNIGGRDFSKVADYYKEFGGNGARIAYYLRVSTVKQARDGRSIDAQRDAMEDLVAREKPSIVYGYSDPGKSGTEFDNRKIMDVEALVKSGLIDEFWVSYIDRIGRDLLKLISFLCVLGDHDVVIRTPEKVYSSDRLPDLVMFILESYMSEKSNIERKERANNSKRKNFMDKKWNKTAVPLGYCKTTSGWLSVKEEWIPIINDVFKYFLKGESYAGISRRINKKYRDILEKTFSSYRVKSILQDPVYVGKPKHYGSMVDDSTLQMVSIDIYQQSQKRLEVLNRRHQMSKNKNPLKELVERYDITSLDFLNKICLQHKDCGGKLVKNGSRVFDGVIRQTFLCKNCGEQFWVPNQTEIEDIQAHHKKKERTINPLRKINKKETKKKKTHRDKEDINNGNTKMDAYFK